MIVIYWACELHTTDVSFGTWQTIAAKGNKCFVAVTWVNEMLLLDLTLSEFFGTGFCSSGLSPSFSIFLLNLMPEISSTVLLDWMMLCISVEALRKPQGTEGRAEQTPPRKESLSGVVCSDKLLKGGWTGSFFFFFFLSLHMLFLFTSSIKHSPFLLTL